LENSIKHIIWDWNGTLLNDRSLALRAINILLQRHALPEVNEEKYLEIFTFPVSDYYQKLGFDFNKTSFSTIGTEFIQEYTERMFTPNLHKNVISTLKYFNKLELSQSLLSAAKQQMLDRLISHHQLNKYFVKVLGLDNHYANSKLQIGKKWVDLLKCNRKEIIFIGDTLHDLDVANTLGAKCALIAHGHNSYQRLLGKGVPVFNNLLELKKWFAQINVKS